MKLWQLGAIIALAPTLFVACNLLNKPAALVSKATDTNKMLANFMKYVGTDKADGYSTQAWGAGLMLRDIVNGITQNGGNNTVTRAAVLKGAANLHKFDADGMLGVRDAGARVPSVCYVLTQVKAGKFVRVSPTKAGTFDCNPKNLYTVKLDLIK